MTPEEVLQMLESVNSLSDVLNNLRVSLEERGWSPAGAELAAIHLMAILAH